MGWPNVYLCIVYRVIATHLIAKEGMYAGFAGAKTGDQKGWPDPAVFRNQYKNWVVAGSIIRLVTNVRYRLIWL